MKTGAKPKPSAIRRLDEVGDYKDDDSPLKDTEVFAVDEAEMEKWLGRPDLPAPNRILVSQDWGMRPGWLQLCWRGGKYLIVEAANKNKETPFRGEEEPGHVGVIVGWYREEASQLAAVR